MATSRTGTAKYLRNSANAKRRAQRDGLTHCPGVDDRPCGVELDYKTPRQSNSAETDHVLEHRYGGDDDPDNLRVICRGCNLGRNAKEPVPVPAADQFPTSRVW